MNIAKDLESIAKLEQLFDQVLQLREDDPVELVDNGLVTFHCIEILEILRSHAQHLRNLEVNK